MVPSDDFPGCASVPSLDGSLSGFTRLSRKARLPVFGRRGGFRAWIGFLALHPACMTAGGARSIAAGDGQARVDGGDFLGVCPLLPFSLAPPLDKRKDVVYLRNRRDENMRG